MKTCKWSKDEDGVYHTACNHAWEFTAGDIKENAVKFCPYCGGKIKEL